MAPMPTHVISAPTPTITQRYDECPIRKCSCSSDPQTARVQASGNKTNGNRQRMLIRRNYFWAPRHCPVAKNAGGYPESSGLGLKK
jgi:hypothetical protein